MEEYIYHFRSAEIIASEQVYERIGWQVFQENIGYRDWKRGYIGIRFYFD
jgi:hypothetical protein